jgi:hypothetical protein
MDEARLAGWLPEYVEAWKSYDPAAIGSLFSEDAVYRYHPWDGATSQVRGRDAIVKNWLEDPDPAGSWTAEYRPWVVHEDRAVAVGVSHYLASDFSAVEREYHNVFLLVFDGEGRCCDFTEVYMKRSD